jgi:benzoylformate decarboxylase
MTQLTGRAAFLRLLAQEGVTHLFGNPGTTELPIMDALAKQNDIQFVLGLQESVVLGMADGFARASGRLAACTVHVAPGLGHGMGALYNARFAGSPMIVTAGQHELGHGLLEPLLYEPLVPIATPLVKWAVEVTRPDDLPRIIHRAATVALTPPTGPVFISLPGDILDGHLGVDLGRPTRTQLSTRPDDATLEHLADRLLTAKRPVIIAGAEISSRDAFAEATAFAEAIGAAVYQEPIWYNAPFPSEHPLFIGALTRNQKSVRAILDQHDLLICLGADLLRMSVQSPIDPLAPTLPVVHLTERPWELGKNYPVEIALQANVKATLAALLPILRDRRSKAYLASLEQRSAAVREQNWAARRATARAATLALAETSPIDPRYLMLQIAENLPPNAIVVEEALTSTTMLPNFFAMRDPRCFYGLASGGLGFAMPGAVGIALAQPTRPVVAIIGDGSAMYAPQALWTAAHFKLPITYIIANNRSYKIIKDRLLARGPTDQFIGMEFTDPPLDFVALAASMGVPARRVSRPSDLAATLRETATGPRLIEVEIAG